ncbi:MAG TPA: CBS domain-containing protein [Opitutaceae bacterium]|nr:CBS domain-containing protein [Opitutaceae bacterium]
MKIPISALLAQKDPTVRCVSTKASAQDAVSIMTAHRIGCVCVLEGERLVGIFTERDVLTRVVAAGLDPRTTPVVRVMTPQPFTIDPSLPLDRAMALISEKRMRHLPVIDDGRLIGLISIGDVNKWVVERLQREADSLRSYISGQYPN